ncbi:MAG: hypothetical protein KC492_29100 [Myxococcales bacterium]|nr:hypothetical protein [Myxococcales bacterium]
MSPSSTSRHLAALLFLGLGACSATSPQNPKSPDPETQSAIALEDEDPDVSAVKTTLRDAGGALVFVRELCDAAKRGDDAFVVEHAALPLRGQEQVGTEQKPLRVAGIATDDSPGSVKNRAVCKYLKPSTRELANFKLEDDEVRGTVKLNGHDYRLTFELDPPKLVEQKLLVENRDPGDPKMALFMAHPPFVFSVRAHGQKDATEHLLALRLEDELSYVSKCAREQAARERVGAALSVQVRTRPERVPQVDLYASTVIDARFLGCLQAQLAPVLQKQLARPTEKRLYDLWMIVGIPTDSADTAGDSEVGGVIGGPEE